MLLALLLAPNRLLLAGGDSRRWPLAVKGSEKQWIKSKSNTAYG